MNIFIAERLVAALKQCLDEPLENCWGICTNVETIVHKSIKAIPGNHVWLSDTVAIVAPYLRQAFESWPKYSGFPGYPVPGINETCVNAYTYAIDKWAGEYGQLRRELCQHIIDYTTRYYNLK